VKDESFWDDDRRAFFHASLDALIRGMGWRTDLIGLLEARYRLIDKKAER
jgi:hypothetical protein